MEIIAIVGKDGEREFVARKKNEIYEREVIAEDERGFRKAARKLGKAGINENTGNYWKKSTWKRLLRTLERQGR